MAEFFKSFFSGMQPQRVFLIVFCSVLLIKFWFAATLPMTGDEALFYWWAQRPSLGYYDHPPMIGWLLAVSAQISNEVLWLRVWSVLIPFAVAVGIVDLSHRLNPQQRFKGWAGGIFYLTLPITWIGVPITNDTPLILFVFLSGYCFIRAELIVAPDTKNERNQHRRLGWYLGAGAFLGLGFLSKYLVVVQAISYAVILLRPKSWGGFGVQHALRMTSLLFLASSPAIALNIVYNSTHCWNNVMFNFINRHEGAEIGFSNTGLYLITITYLLTPWAIWRLSKNKISSWRESSGLVLLALAPLIFFLFLSLFKRVGLHWLLSFLPFFALLITTQFAADKVNRLIVFNAVFSCLHIVIVIALLFPPFLLIEKSSLAKGFYFLKDAPHLSKEALRGAPSHTVLMAEGYSPAAVLGYHSRQYVPVFGQGSRYAREDDTRVDFSSYHGSSIRIFLRKEPDLTEFKPFFEEVDSFLIRVEDRLYWVVSGNGFNFYRYREQVLRRIADRYYRIPAGLPMYSCNFLSKYRFLIDDRQR